MGDKIPRPLDGDDTAPLRAYMVNTPAGSMPKSESNKRCQRSSTPTCVEKYQMEHAPFQYSNSKSESEDTLLEDEVASLESDGYHGGRLDNLPSEKPNSLSKTLNAVIAEYDELRAKNMAEVEDMLEKPDTTIAELEELQRRQMPEYMKCYMKLRAVNDESAARLMEMRAEVADMLQMLYQHPGEEVSRVEMIRRLERILELHEQPASSPGLAGH